MRGSHGTCNSFARSIESEGFQEGEVGRFGRGVYFWVIDDSSNGMKLGRTLAQAWYNKACKDRYFDEEDDKELSVIFADLKSNNTLDFYHPKVAAGFKAHFDLTVSKYDKLGDVEKSNIFDRFVDKMEEASGHQVDLVTGATRIPTTGIVNNPQHIAYTMHFHQCAAVRNIEIVSNISCEYSATGS